MSDLEQLARHLHEAPEGTVSAVFQSGRPFWSNQLMVNSYRMAEIKAKRDELSGKPKEWVNDWARYRAQDSNGQWWEFDREPMHMMEVWRKFSNVEKFELVSEGKALGDWRDTLEEREMGETISVKGAYEVSEEVQRETDMYARAFEQPTWDGEGLPPVGTVCEWNRKTNPYWDVCEIIAYSDSQVCVMNKESAELNPDKLEVKALGYCEFRPLRTEREIQVEAMADIAEKAVNVVLGSTYSTQIANALYDAGYRKQEN